MADALTNSNDPTPLWCTCDKPLPVHIAERKGAARSVCARCERPLRLQLRLDPVRAGRTSPTQGVTESGTRPLPPR